MKIWLPYLQAGSGTDIFTLILSDALNNHGHEVKVTPFAHYWQYAPWRLKFAAMPPNTDIIVANSWNGFAFKRPGTKLIIVEHLFVLDPTLAPYRSFAQSIFHNTLIRNFLGASYRSADSIVGVSEYVANRINDTFPDVPTMTIHNGVDTEFFVPSATQKVAYEGSKKLLFVGNLLRRKGADLLVPILEQLGPGYEFQYTSGLRTRDPFEKVPGMISLGQLNREQIRDAYQNADVVVFPTRLEGFGYAAAEAMACGTPVVTTDCSSLPELVEDRVTGRLCPIDNVLAFTQAILELFADKESLNTMGQRARRKATSCFSIEVMVWKYLDLFNKLLEK